MPAPVTAVALRYTRYGGPEVIERVEREVPAPGPGEVRVQVRAAALNPFDAKSRAGRFAGGAAAPAGPVWIGYDLAGVVEAVGPDEVDWAVGDEVLGLATGGTGAMATHALAKPVAAKPHDAAWVDAAAWPTVTEAAVRGVDLLEVRRGETLLVHGGFGSVGLLVVQLGLRAGARVVATAGERDHGALEALGAVPVAYGDGWAGRVRDAVGGAGVDAVLDAAGAGVLQESAELAGGPGRVVTLAGDDAEAAGARFSGGGDEAGKARAIAAVPGLMTDGVRLPVGGVWPFSEAEEAYRELDRGTRGKLVVSV